LSRSAAARSVTPAEAKAILDLELELADVYGMSVEDRFKLIADAIAEDGTPPADAAALVRRVIAGRRKSLHDSDSARDVVALALPVLLDRVSRKDHKYVMAVTSRMEHQGLLEVYLGTEDWKLLGCSRQGGTNAMARVIRDSRGILRRTHKPSSRNGRAAVAWFRKRHLSVPWFYQVNRRALPKEL
jgi:hypothetical protein